MRAGHKFVTSATAVIAVACAVAVTGPGIAGAAPGAGRASTAVAARALVRPDTPGAQLWVRRFAGREGLHESAAQSVTVSPRGGRVFVTGFSAIRGSHGGTIGTATTIAYSTASGASLWLARFAAPGTGDGSGAGASAIAASPDGRRVFVAATTGKDNLHDYATIGYAAATGARLWLARYDGTGGGDHETGIAVSPDGSRVFVTGYSSGAGSGFDYATVAYSAATGQQLWAARYNGPVNKDDFAAAVAVSPRGDRVFVTGASRAPASGTSVLQDYATVAYSAATGSQLWVRRHQVSPTVTGEDPGARAIAVSHDGQRILVTGSSGRAALTIAYTAVGQQRWLARYRPAGGASATAIAIGPSGKKVFVVGRSGHSYVTIGYGSGTGRRLWTSLHFGGRHFPQVSGASAVAVNPGGSMVYVTGSTGGPFGAADYGTVAYRSDSGSLVWARRYNGTAGSDDRANAIAIGPSGSRVFVTGASTGQAGTAGRPGLDYATVAYHG